MSMHFVPHEPAAEMLPAIKPDRELTLDLALAIEMFDREGAGAAVPARMSRDAIREACEMANVLGEHCDLPVMRDIVEWLRPVSVVMRDQITDPNRLELWLSTIARGLIPLARGAFTAEAQEELIRGVGDRPTPRDVMEVVGPRSARLFHRWRTFSRIAIAGDE